MNVITIAAVVPSGPQATDVSGPSLFCTIGVPITDCHAVQSSLTTPLLKAESTWTLIFYTSLSLSSANGGGKRLHFQQP
ncbi:hypothetical protein TSPI_08820 [Trichinella spiralis]|uniref:Uncharacterized protein n=1 Tax=Trichinella spiralis TaxID=6334 RepID=A0ABR3KTY5_TRISP